MQGHDSKNALDFPAESEKAMSDVAINYEAVLADLESRKAQLESAIAAIRLILAQGVGAAGPGGGGGGGTIAPDAFLQMSIPDATKKFLNMTRQKQSTQSIIDALEKGGLPRSKYNTVYSILARRQSQVGDIINMQGDWALDDWYPNYKKKSKAQQDAEEKSDEALKEIERLAEEEPKKVAKGA